ncbi:MAG: hypothetical protein WC330_06255 [Candidatus Omnitrophota bacterium]|jgi:hypothetical protein
MKRIAIIFAITILFFPPVYSEQLSREDVVRYANQIIKNIYNEIWRIRDRYPELKDFGPQNLSDTMELSSYYTKIKKIRIKSAESESRHRFFREEQFTGDKDTLYIAFSETSRVHGTIAVPAAVGKFNDLDLYILVFSNTDNQFFKHDMITIVKQNSVVAEQASY